MIQLRLNSKLCVLALCVAMTTACDDDTSSMGIYPASDGISNSTSVYQIISRSVAMDSVTANSSVCYLGSITDPETNTDITADFAAQFYTFEDYSMPADSLMMGTKDGMDQRGVIQCDSIDLHLYFDDYYGDDDNPMKIEVYELSYDNLLSEDSTYYTDLDLSQFVDEGTSPVASRMFTPYDYNVAESSLTSSSYAHNVHIALPTSYGQTMMEKYYENPDYYRNSYNFIRNVMPGFYFKTSSGRGTQLSLFVSTCNLYFHYYDVTGDSICTGLTRFSATPEVIQSTRFTNADMEELIADSTVTYLKTPAGICTELTLPVDEVFSGEHASDSLSLCSVTLTRYNKDQDDYQLDTPETLLMVRKDYYHDFFANKEVTDSRTSYTTSFSSSYNTYEFSNICRLISYMKHEKANEASEQGITEEEWAEQHPDWNKVLLIPVTTSEDTNGNLISVTHDLGLGSVRLVGGTTKIDMQVVYSKFAQ